MTTEEPFEPKGVEEPKPHEGDAAPMPTVPTTAAMTRLALKVQDIFRVNSEHRRNVGVDAMLEYAGRASKMKYEPSKCSVLVNLGIDPRNFRPLTVSKIRAAKAMLNDIINQSGDKPFTCSPTPDPEVPKHVEAEVMMRIAKETIQFLVQQGGALPQDMFAALQVAIVRRVSTMHDEIMRAKKEWAAERCARMETRVHDQFVQGGFIEEFNRLVNFICVYGTAVMIGPVPRVESVTGCKEIGGMGGIDGAVKYDMEYRVVPTYETVSPWDCYPSPNSRKIGQGPICFKVRYAANELWQYSDAMEGAKNGPEGWQAETVRALLSQYPNGGVRLDMDATDVVRREIEGSSIAPHEDCTLEGIRCFSSVRGSELISFGVLKTPDGKRVSYKKYYKTETIVIAGYVVYCRIIDDRMKLPIVKAVLYESPDSWWGESLPQILYSAQSIQNNALKNLIQNDALSSNGVFYCTDVGRAVSLDGSPALSIRAGKMLGFKQSQVGNTGAPVGVMNITSTVEQQLRELSESQKMADDDSGIPAYTYGSTSTSAGSLRTASGMAMATEAASRVIKMCICGLGRDVIVPTVKNTVVWNLINSDDMSIKGDCEVMPSGLMGKIFREQESQRRQQMMAALGNHPVLGPAIGVEGFFELIRPELEELGINVDKVIPSKERMQFVQEVLDMMKMMQAAGGQKAASAEGAEPTPEQANVARVEGQPQEVALQGGGAGEPAPGTVEERRSVA